MVDNYYDNHFVNTHTARQNSLEQMLSPLPEGPEGEPLKVKAVKKKKCVKGPRRNNQVNRSKESLMDNLDSSQRIY